MTRLTEARALERANDFAGEYLTSGKPIEGLAAGQFVQDFAAALMVVAREEHNAALDEAAGVVGCTCAEVCGEEPGRPLCNNELAAAILALKEPT